MPKLAANLSMLFTEYPVLERFDRASSSGFRAVEYLLPYGDNPDDILSALDRNSLALILMNLPSGDWLAGDRGIAAQPARQAEFAAGIQRAVEYATALRPRRMNCLAGRLGPEPESMEVLASNVQAAATALADINVQLVVEPVNPFDVEGFALPTTQAAMDLIARVGHPNVGLQYDVYHAIRMGEDPFAFIDQNGRSISHIQIADVPGRHQPGTGEIEFERLFSTIDASGYDGWVSLEYVPEGPTESGFDLLRTLGLLG